jgi:hypothetical protein
MAFPCATRSTSTPLVMSCAPSSPTRCSLPTCRSGFGSPGCLAKAHGAHPMGMGPFVEGIEATLEEKRAQLSSARPTQAPDRCGSTPALHFIAPSSISG